MASSSISILGRICRKGGFAAGTLNWNVPATRSASHCRFSNRCIHQMISNPSISKKSSSPWLMLPPGPSDLKFYSLAENTVINVSVEKEISDLFPKLDFVGSSHGWLALFNPYNLDLFLYNPISRRRVNLPPVRTLPNIPDVNLEGGYGCVTKVIVSCSPDDPDQDCRAMAAYNTTDALAFCCPGESSNEWTPIADLYRWDENGSRSARSYGDFVYSDAQKLFLCFSNDWELESWDLRDPSSPKRTLIYREDIRDYDTDEEEEEESKPWCEAVDHIVVDEQRGDLFLVSQNVMENMAPDGSYVDFSDEGSEKCPHKTVDFDVFKYDPEEGGLEKMDDSSLGGLALFTGFYGHSMALSTSEFPELKPNSIYFTDPYESPSRRINHDRKPFNGHDIGIFDCQDKTISSCYYPCDVRSFKKIVPAPMWFFPSPI